MEFPDIRHQRFFDYWDEKRAGRLAPRRADIDPLDFPDLLPNVFIFKVLNDPRDYELTLLGTQLVEVLGRDFTGCTFDEMYRGEAAAMLRRQYDAVVDGAEPDYAENDASWMAKDYIAYRRLLLPLSDDGVSVNRLLGCAFFTPKD